MRRPLITVITTVRNGGELLRETIRSIQEQSVRDWEYLIVDDASTDGTIEVVEQELHRDKRIRLLRRSEQGGPYVAANDALAVSRGRFVMRTDGDDLQPVYRFERQLAFLAENQQYKACVSYWQAFDERGFRPGVVSIPSSKALKWHLLMRGPSIHSSLCIEREAMSKIGGYHPLPLSQDYRLWCELAWRGWLGVIPAPLSYVRMHPARSTNTRAALQRDLAKDVLRQHWKRMTGEELCPGDIESLWAMGHTLPYEVEGGLRILARWNSLWRADDSLDAATYDELSRLSDIRRRKFLRVNLRREPVTVAVGVMTGVMPAVVKDTWRRARAMRGNW